MAQIQIGMNGRFFPNNWRPARDEIAFAGLVGFACLQFPGPPQGLGLQQLGDSLETVALALKRAGITAVMEMIVDLYSDGRTESGLTPLDILNANLPAILTLPCRRVHWHVTLPGVADPDASQQLEAALIPQLATAVQIAQRHGFLFGLEHNSSDAPIFHTPARCRQALTAVPGLGFVWDINHTAAASFAAYAELVPRATLLHVSDTPWPEVNHHLPLGLGNLDLAAFGRALAAGSYHGPAILEIGGLPKSGGYGRDSDEALIDSRHRLAAAWSPAAG